MYALRASCVNMMYLTCPLFVSAHIRTLNERWTDPIIVMTCWIACTRRVGAVRQTTNATGDDKFLIWQPFLSALPNESAV